MTLTTDVDEWIRFVFPEYKSGTLSTENGALLTLRNLVVDELNGNIADYLKSGKMTLYSVDSLNVAEETAGIAWNIWSHKYPKNVQQWLL